MRAPEHIIARPARKEGVMRMVEREPAEKLMRLKSHSEIGDVFGEAGSERMMAAISTQVTVHQEDCEQDDELE
jgi:hypothetical protein